LVKRQFGGIPREIRENDHYQALDNARSSSMPSITETLDLALERHQAGELEAAEGLYQRILQVEPQHADALHLLGMVYFLMGKYDEAAELIERAIVVKPQQALFLTNLAAVYLASEKFAESVACGLRAVGIDPNDYKAHYNLACAYCALRKLSEGIASGRRAVQIKPDHADAHYLLGAAFQREGNLDDSAASFKRALQFSPEQPLWELKIKTLWASVFDSKDQMERRYQQFSSDVRDFSKRPFRLNPTEISTAACEPPFNLQFHEDDIRPIKEAYAEIFRDHIPRATLTAREGLARIGFVVTNGHERIFLKSMQGVLEHLNRDLFEVIVLCPAAAAERIRAEFGDQAIRTVLMPMRFEQTVDAIWNSQCDLLYYWEVGTDAINYFLPFFRLAPVQCTSWGVQVTSGIPQMDYYLSSALVEPENADRHYSETLLLATTLLTYQYRATLPERAKQRQTFGFTPDQHLYLCAQNLGKFHPDFDAYLAGILRRDHRGVLVVTQDQHAHAAKKLRQRFARSIPDVAERIAFLPQQSGANYLSLTAAADVLLDPPYFGGVNTTYDGFSLNKPIVTIPSHFHRGRYTLGCYKKMQLTECVASDRDEYIEIAVRLGTDADYRAEITQRIRQANPVLFEDQEAVREHERIFVQLVEEGRSRSIT
jgi:predicted O-linked N-acetylglucosamine transferase (SPINDLY family)